MAATTIIFDLGGVLVSTNWERVAGPLAELSGRPPEAVTEEIFTGDAGYRFMVGKIGQTEFHRRLTRHLDIDSERFFEIWASVIEPRDEVTGLIERLRGRYRLAIGSNTDPVHWQRGLEVQEALKHFRDALLSYELGVAKPDPEFFRLGLAELSTSAEECVFIDDKSENVEAAESLGIAGVRFVSGRPARVRPDGAGRNVASTCEKGYLAPS